MDTTYTLELTEAQYAALLERVAELEISWRTCSSRPCKIS